MAGQHKKWARWRPEEDILLRTMVSQHGRHWSRMLHAFPGRKPMDLLHHYDDLTAGEPDAPDKLNSRWSAEEKRELSRLVGQHGRHWRLVAEGLPERNPMDCFNMWGRLVKRGDEAGSAARPPASRAQPREERVAVRAEPRECAEPPPSPWIVEALARQNGVCSWSCEDSRQLLRLVAQHGQDWARGAEGLPRHDATSAAAPSAVARSAGVTWAASPSSSASARNESSLRPANATIAPWACRMRATEPPMPPDAPVTSTVSPALTRPRITAATYAIA